MVFSFIAIMVYILFNLLSFAKALDRVDKADKAELTNADDKSPRFKS
jgi:hypothetical protein